MISFFSGEKLPRISEAPTFIETKIEATFKAYKNKYPFCAFWVQHENEQPTALILKFEQALFVKAEKEANFDELRNFFAATGYDSLQADLFVFSKLGIIPSEVYTVLALQQTTQKNEETINRPSLKRIYEILYAQENRHLEQTDYMAWYADISHRLRHETAAVAIEQDVSVAIASHVTESAAVISGVATLKHHRKNGLGSIALRNLLAQLFGRKVFAAAESAVLPFYLSNNFTKCGEVAVYNSRKGN